MSTVKKVLCGELKKKTFPKKHASYAIGLLHGGKSGRRYVAIFGGVEIKNFGSEVVRLR